MLLGVFNYQINSNSYPYHSQISNTGEKDKKIVEKNVSGECGVEKNKKRLVQLDK